LIAVHFKDLRNAEEVIAVLQSKGTLLIEVNSVCGYAAGAACPGVKLSLETTKRPNRIATAFAGFDTGAK
jgi:putative YphP/YqiW family bacilliredoxin